MCKYTILQKNRLNRIPWACDRAVADSEHLQSAVESTPSTGSTKYNHHQCRTAIIFIIIYITNINNYISMNCLESIWQKDEVGNNKVSKQTMHKLHVAVNEKRPEMVLAHLVHGQLQTIKTSCTLESESTEWKGGRPQKNWTKGNGCPCPMVSLGAVLSLLHGPWARRWTIHKACDTWPVRHQTYGHLSSLRASLPFDRYQVILLGDRGTQSK